MTDYKTIPMKTHVTYLGGPPVPVKDLVFTCRVDCLVGVCKARTDECSLLRDLVFLGYTEGYGEPYDEELEAYRIWREVYHI
jgi:hypothetical protein